MTLNSETHRVGQEGINISAACCNLSPLVVEVVSDLFRDYLQINFKLSSRKMFFETFKLGQKALTDKQLSHTTVL